MPTAKLSSKSQIVIPVEIRRRLGLEPGDVLKVEVEGDRMVLTREDRIDPLERLRSFRGTLPTGSAAEILRDRASWDAPPRDR
jgi:antitoxin PrlF